MPTQEERLTIVEYDLKQFKTETVKVYGDMAFEMTIIKGLTENAIGRLSTLSNTTEKHFERVDIRLDAMDAHLESMDKRLSQTEKHFERVDIRLDAMDAHLESMDTRLNQMDTRLDRVENMLTQILARLPEK